MERRPFTAHCPEDVRGNEENVNADDDVGDKLVRQLCDQLVLVRDVVLLILKLVHVFAEQAADDQVGEGLKNCSEMRKFQ